MNRRTHSWSLRWWCSPPGGCRLWSGRWRGAAGRTHWWGRGTGGDALCGLEEQKSHSQLPGERCSAGNHADTGRRRRMGAAAQLLRTWRFYGAPRGIWANFSCCYGDGSPRGRIWFGFLAKMKMFGARGKQKAKLLPWRSDKQRPRLLRNPLTPRPASPKSEVNLTMGGGGAAALQQDGELMMKRKATWGHFP